MNGVKRYTRRLSRMDLPGALLHRGPAEEELPSEIDLDALHGAVSEALNDDLTGTAIDRALVEPVHRSLAGMTRREAADMRVWHWLCVDQFQGLVKRRWVIEPASLVPGEIKDSTAGHFLGNSNMVGIARNTFARLWWTAEQLGDYDEARVAFSNAEDFVAVFERLYGLYLPASKASLTRFSDPDLSDDDQREAAKWLQQNLSTTVLESLDEARIGEILDESLPPR